VWFADGREPLIAGVRRNQLSKDESEPMNKTTAVVAFLFFAHLPIICGGLVGLLIGAVDPASATSFMEARSSSVLASMLAHGLFWGIMIAAAQNAVVLAAALAVMLAQRGKKSAVVR